MRMFGGAAIAGLADAWLWVRLVDSVLHRRPPIRSLPVAPIGIHCSSKAYLEPLKPCQASREGRKISSPCFSER